MIVGDEIGAKIRHILGPNATIWAIFRNLSPSPEPGKIIAL